MKFTKRLLTIFGWFTPRLEGKLEESICASAAPLTSNARPGMWAMPFICSIGVTLMRHVLFAFCCHLHADFRSTHYGLPAIQRKGFTANS